jgi:hypothetical protein
VFHGIENRRDGFSGSLCARTYRRGRIVLAREMLFGILLVAFIALGCMSLGRAEVVR